MAIKIQRSTPPSICLGHTMAHSILDWKNFLTLLIKPSRLFQSFDTISNWFIGHIDIATTENAKPIYK